MCVCVCVCVRRLSASAVHVTEMEEADQSLSRQLRQHSMSSSLDTHTLRIRKMSLDNRYIHSIQPLLMLIFHLDGSSES